MRTRAVTFARYGPPSVLRVESVELPPLGPRRVRVRVHAAALNPKDILVRKGKLRWLVGRTLPRRTGYDFAGVVEACRSGEYGVQVGQRVFGMLNAQAAGAMAEHVDVPATELAPIPDALSFVDAAAIPLAGQTALQALRDLARVRAGHRVWIHGASGGVGTFAIQVAKSLGAQVVTTSSAANLELCRSLGADEALDYRVDRPWEQRAAYDAIFDVFGNQRFSKCRAALRRPGAFVSTVPSLRILQATARTLFSSRRARLVLVRSKAADLTWLADQVEWGRLTPRVDRTFPLGQIAQAHAFIETKRARGKVVVELTGASDDKPGPG
ncbi:MAG: NAD(P)-dependent alcohol dehydrogenase [Myxococcota bacterium]